MLTEFLQFLQKTNALALAIAAIIGGAIGKVITSVVNDLSMPVIGIWPGGGDWRRWRIVLETDPDGKVLSAIGVGSFLGSLVDFLVIAGFVFAIAKTFLREPAPAPAAKTCGACGESILATAARCKFSTSAV